MPQADSPTSIEVGICECLEGRGVIWIATGVSGNSDSPHGRDDGMEFIIVLRESS